MAWQKGQSGNPGGRRRQDYRIKEVAQQYTSEALKTLLEIMRNKRTAAGARVLAIRELLDRGWGKPAQSVEITNPDGSLSSAWQAAVKAIDEQPREAEVQH